MLRSMATNCSLLMNEKPPAKRSIPPHPAFQLGGVTVAKLYVRFGIRMNRLPPV